MTIHSFWISGELQPINYLCIKSFLEHGHDFHLYTYEKDLKVDCKVLDARTIMPESEIFYYKNMMDGKPHFKFGGIAERLKAELLYKLGGWHVDLDVVCLKPFDTLTNPFVFRPLGNSIIANIIKAPAKCEFSRYYLDWTKTINADNTEWSKSHEGLKYGLEVKNLREYIVGKEIFGVDELEWLQPLFKTIEYDYQIEYIKNCYAIHFCQAWLVELGLDKNYEQGSFYDSLLKKYQ